MGRAGLLNKVCELVFEQLKMAKKIATTELFNTRQNVWEVLIEDVYEKKPLLL